MSIGSNLILSVPVLLLERVRLGENELSELTLRRLKNRESSPASLAAAAPVDPLVNSASCGFSGWSFMLARSCPGVCVATSYKGKLKSQRPHGHAILLNRSQLKRDYPLNLSILLRGGKETNKDSLSNGE